MYPHRIRLRGPWECEPLERVPPTGEPPPAPRRMTLPCRWAEGGLAGFAGRVAFRRRFGYPGRIDAHERVWLTLAGVDARAEVRLNGAALGECGGDGPFEYEITRLLQVRNELVVDLEGTAERGGLWGETALEVRCRAFLRDVRLWATFADGRVDLQVAGLAVGEAERPLELYVVVGRGTVAYGTVAPSPAGTPFHLTAANVPAGEAERFPPVKVDLVNGAVVWYTLEREFPMPLASLLGGEGLG